MAKIYTNSGGTANNVAVPMGFQVVQATSPTGITMNTLQANSVMSTNPTTRKIPELSKNSLIAKYRISLNYKYYKTIINLSNQLSNYCGVHSNYTRSIQIDDNEFNTELKYLNDCIEHYKVFKFSTEELMRKCIKGFDNNFNFKVLDLNPLYNTCKYSEDTANKDIADIIQNLPITSTFKKIKLTNEEKIQMIKSCITRNKLLQKVLIKCKKDGDKTV